MLYSAIDLKVVIVVVYLFVCLFACFRSFPTSIRSQPWCTLTLQSKSVRWEWLMAQLSLTIWERTSPLLTHTHPAMSWESSGLTPKPLSFSISWWIREIVWCNISDSLALRLKGVTRDTMFTHIYIYFWPRKTHVLWMHKQSMNHISLKKRPRCCAKSSTAQNMFRPIQGLISCARVIRRWRLRSHACTECSYVAGLIQKCGRDSSKELSLRVFHLKTVRSNCNL